MSVPVQNQNTLDDIVLDDPVTKPHFTKGIYERLVGASALYKKEFDAALKAITGDGTEQNPGDATDPAKLSALQMTMGAYTSSLTMTASILNAIKQANDQVISKT